MTNDELLRARLKPALDRIIDATECAHRLQKAWIGWAALEIAKKTKQRLNMAKSKHELVEEAKAEARLNLSGEDLEKCLTALDNWERNCY